MHGNIEKLFVEERNATFHTPGTQAFVSPETVIHIEFAQFTDGLFVKSLCIRGFVEIEVTPEHFIRPFATQYHLYPHRFDYASQQVHRSGGADSCHVVCLDVVDHVTNGIESFLDRVVDLVVDSTDIISHFLGCH